MDELEWGKFRSRPNSVAAWLSFHSLLNFNFDQKPIPILSSFNLSLRLSPSTPCLLFPTKEAPLCSLVFPLSFWVETLALSPDIAMKGRGSKAEPRKAEAKLSVKKGAAAAGKKAKPTKDPNKPKRPPSAFFVFMEEFRVQFKQKHPNNKSVAAVGKAAGEKWKSMSAADKAPYMQKAEKRKTDYQKQMTDYNNAEADAKKHKEAEEEEGSEVHDDDDDEDGSEEEEDDD